MKKFTFSEKNRLRAAPICWIGRALYAKTSHHYLCRLGMLGVLSSSCNGARLLGAESQVCLHRCFWKKAVRRSCGQVLPEENRGALCEDRYADRSKTPPGSDHCRRTRPRALAFKMLAFCKGSARRCRRGEVPAANNVGETGWSGAGEQLRVQKAPRIRSL